MSDITFAVSEEQQLLRDTARKFLADRSPSEKVREDMSSDLGFDEALWAETAQMGWQAMAVPEEYGGAGYGWTEVAVLAEEMGRALFCAPYLSSAVLSVAAILAAGSDTQRKELLPGIASGELRATVAHLADRASVTVESGTLSGTATHVLDVHTAHVLLVPVTEDGATSLYVVRADADGVTVEETPSLDLTRRLGAVTLDGAAGERLGEPGSGDAALAAAVEVGAVVVANEQVGGAQRVLEMGVQYGKDRIQFGRAIGSFQAIKHRLAEMLVSVESAKSVAYHAARVLDGDDGDERAIAVPMAAAYCGEIYERAAGDNIQVHGGIGFTWEHDAHLFYKRAKHTKLLFGGPKAWRRRLADTLEL